MAKSGSPFSDYSIMIYISSCIFMRKKFCPQNFLKYMYLRYAVIQNLFCCQSTIFKQSYIHQKNLFVSVEELFNVVELVSVEDTSSARFACYGMKINILECCRFQGWGTQPWWGTEINLNFRQFYIHIFEQLWRIDLY